MQQRVTFIGNARKGVLEIVDRDKFRRDFANTFNYDTVVEGVIRRQEKDKSRPMERYYWSVVLPCQCKFHNVLLADGEPDVEWMHEMNLYRYARRITRVLDGKEIEVYKRTSAKKGDQLGMKLREQYEFIERVKAEEAIMGNYIPDPNENIEPSENEAKFDLFNKHLDLEKQEKT
jgi:hypothetical protein